MSAEPITLVAGTIEQVDGCFEARLERTLAHEQESVWAMLTDPARLVEWLASGEMEPRQGGLVKLKFADSETVIESTLSAYQPPRLLEYSWGANGEPPRPVRFETSADGALTRLTLTLRIPADEDIARTCAGWEAHLAMLEAALDGSPIDFPFERFQAAREIYRSMG